MILKALVIIISMGIFSSCICRSFTITDFGAKGDGKTVNTQFIQAAIDSASKSGGGQVIVPPNTFLTGSILLKNNVELYLSQGSILLGSLNFFDYKKTDRWYALVLAKDQTNISITGKGVIDGRGGLLAHNIDSLIKAKVISDPNYSGQWKRPHESLRPQLIEFLKCENITVKNISLKDAACWVQTYHNCKKILIDSIRVESMAYWNNDGIDISDCKNVKITGCFVNSADDGICLKSDDAKLYCDSITVENCTVRSSASAVKFGTASLGGFKNVTIKNIYVYDTYRSAIAIESVDGGNIENIMVSDITAKNTGNALFLRTGFRKGSAPGYIKDVTIKNLKAEIPIGIPDSGYPFQGPPTGLKHNLIPSSIVGLPESKIKNVSLENIEITFGGGGKREVANIPLDNLKLIPENKNSYPEFSMFGELPATGIFVRNADGLTMKNCNVKVVNEDFRPAFVFDNVANLRIDSSVISPTHKNEQVILNNVKGYSIKNLIASNGTTKLIKMYGSNVPLGVTDNVLYSFKVNAISNPVFSAFDIQGRVVFFNNSFPVQDISTVNATNDKHPGGLYIYSIRHDDNKSTNLKALMYR